MLIILQPVSFESTKTINSMNVNPIAIMGNRFGFNNSSGLQMN